MKKKTIAASAHLTVVGRRRKPLGHILESVQHVFRSAIESYRRDETGERHLPSADAPTDDKLTPAPRLIVSFAARGNGRVRAVRPGAHPSPFSVD